VVEAFGPGVLAADGTLDRAALAKIVFVDEAARERLNRIVHPLVRRRSRQRLVAAPADAVVVEDVPLLAEGGLAASFHLVVAVHAAAEQRIRRLAQTRGMSEAEARARIRAQADDAARRAAADVWLVNGGGLPALRAEVDRLWSRRLVPFEDNLRRGRAIPEGPPRLVPSDPSWPEQAARLAARVSHAVRVAGGRVWHVGSTAVPDLPARDVVDLVLAADPTLALTGALADAGFPATGDGWHGGADPGRPVRVDVLPPGTPELRRSLLLRDWLRADPAARAAYLAAKRRLAGEYGRDDDAARYASAKRAWLDGQRPAMERWANAAGWDEVSAARS
jgi:dephospho-CoA kinase